MDTMRKIGEIENEQKSTITLGFTQIIRKLVKFELKGSDVVHFAQFEMEIVPKGKLVLSKIEVFTSCDENALDDSHCKAFLNGIENWLEALNKNDEVIENFILTIKDIEFHPEDSLPESFQLAIANALSLVCKQEKPTLNVMGPTNSIKVIDLPISSSNEISPKKAI